MSIDATKWAWSQTIAPSQKIVLLSMADRAGETHVCWPSLARLQADTCLDRKTIMGAIFQLEEAGLIAVKRQIGQGNSYQLIGVNDRETSTKNGTGSGIKNTPSTSTNNGTTTSTKNGTSTENGTSTNNGTPTSPKNGTTTSTKNGTLNLPLNPNGINHGDFDVSEDQTPAEPVNRNSATLSGAVCIALKAIGMPGVSPSNLMLKTLIDAGADLGVFVDAGKKAVERQKGFEYMLKIVKNQMADCASFAESAHSAPSSTGLLPGAI